MRTSKVVVSQRKRSWSCVAFLKSFQQRLKHSYKERSFPWKRTKKATSPKQQNSRAESIDDGYESANVSSETRFHAPFYQMKTNDLQECLAIPPDLQKMRNLLLLFRHRMPQDTVIHLHNALTHLEESYTAESDVDLESDDDLEIPTERTVGDHLKIINQFVTEKDFAIEEKVRKKEDFSEKDTYFLDSEMVRRMTTRKHFREYLTEVKNETKKVENEKFKNGKDESGALTEPSPGGDDVIKSLGMVDNGVYHLPVKSHSQCIFDGIKQIAFMIDITECRIPQSSLQELDKILEKLLRTKEEKREKLARKFIEAGMCNCNLFDLREYHNVRIVTIPSVFHDVTILHRGSPFFCVHPRTSVFKKKYGFYGDDSCEADIYGKLFVGVYFPPEIYIGENELGRFYKDFVFEKLWRNCYHKRFESFYAPFLIF